MGSLGFVFLVQSFDPPRQLRCHPSEEGNFSEGFLDKKKLLFRFHPLDKEMARVGSPPTSILTIISIDILNSFHAQLDTTFVPSGVYVLPPGFKAGIVVVHRLPKTPATLWFRMLGKGPNQEGAIEELVRLPADNPYRRDVLELLANLQQFATR
jgi:hypothetical protein